MNKEYKEKWLKALRSGEYEQCTGELFCADGGYCCLGVLVHAVHGRNDERVAGDPKVNPYYDGGDSGSPYGFEPKVSYKLYRMNDTLINPFSFTDIADWIEENL